VASRRERVCVCLVSVIERVVCSSLGGGRAAQTQRAFFFPISFHYKVACPSFSAIKVTSSQRRRLNEKVPGLKHCGARVGQHKDEKASAWAGS
jgi:hypothetical protein